MEGIYIYIYIYTGGGQKKVAILENMVIFGITFARSRTETYGKRYVFRMHVMRSDKISSQILILIIGLY